MPPKLGAADSFNSSGATIVPSDHPSYQSFRRQRDDSAAVASSNNNNVSTLSTARVLMPQDTLGRELDEALRASAAAGEGAEFGDGTRDIGAGADDGGVRSQSASQTFDAEAMLREFGYEDFTSMLDTSNNLPNINPSTLTSTNLNLIADLQIDPSSGYTQTHLSHSDHTSTRSSPLNSHSHSPFELSSNPLQGQQANAQGHGGQTSPFGGAAPPFQPFRPSSAHSHRSSVSGSDYSYTNTEVSGTDVSADEDVRMDGPGPTPDTDMALRGIVPGWATAPAHQHPHIVTGAGAGAGHGTALGANGIAGTGAGAGELQYPSPLSATGGPSPPTVPGAMFGGPGPIRGVAGTVGVEDDAKKRMDRLEHRRSINRRSAQKHRARRKEELDVLNKTIADKEARIAQLERDLAVERSRTVQLAEFIKISIGKSRVPGGGTVGSGSSDSIGGGAGAEGSGEQGDEQAATGRRSARRSTRETGP